MKNIYKKIGLMLFVGFFLAACEDNAIPEITSFTKDGAYVKFFFHVDGAPLTNFYLNDQKVTAALPSADSLELGKPYKSVYPSNAYAVVPAGNATMNAIAADGTAAILATLNVALEEKKHYSAYLVGTPDNYETFVIQDKLPSPDHTKIYWRFVNTMANMPFEVDAYAVRAAVQPTDENPAGQEAEAVKLGTNLGFKAYGSYVELEPGRYTYKVFPSNTTYDPFTDAPYIMHSVTLGSLGRVYTTQIRGSYAEIPSRSQIDFWRER